MSGPEQFKSLAVETAATGGNVRTITIKKEIPVDFEARVKDYHYSFNLKEEITLRHDVRDGSVDFNSCWSHFEPIKIVDEKILKFCGSNGQWVQADEIVQNAYQDYLANKQLLDN